MGATEEDPSTSTTTVPWIVAGAREAVAAAEGHVVGTLGPTAAAGEAGPTTELGTAASVAPGVEVSVRGVGPWRTGGREE